jgi:hypothetical protein
MSRVKINVSRGLLEQVIKDVESNPSPPRNREDLWVLVVEEYNKYAIHKVTKAVLYQRYKEFGLSINTPRAKKRVTESNSSGQRGMNTLHQERLKKHKASFDAIKKVIPKQFINLVVLAEQGSLRATINLKCLDCTSFQVKEIKGCTLVSCPLYPVRPYQQMGEGPKNA